MNRQLRRAGRIAWLIFRTLPVLFGIALIEGIAEAAAREWMFTRHTKKVQRAYDRDWGRRG